MKSSNTHLFFGLQVSTFIFFILADVSFSNINLERLVSSNSQIKHLEIDSNVHLKDFTRINLQNEKIYPWFKNIYDLYIPEPSKIDSLQKIKDHIKILIYGGSWCSDTKKLLPAFYKVMEILKVPPENIILIGVDRRKSSHGRGSFWHHIRKVPTFILYYDGKEIGRIVESVQQSIETDILKIYHDRGCFKK